MFGKKRECSTDRVTHGEGDDRPYWIAVNHRFVHVSPP